MSTYLVMAGGTNVIAQMFRKQGIVSAGVSYIRIYHPLASPLQSVHILVVLVGLPW